MHHQHHAPAAKPTWTRVTARTTLVALALAVAITAALGWLLIARTQGRETLASTSQLRADQAADLTSSLTRSGLASEGTAVDVILATPTFFQLTGRPKEAAELGADRFLVFVANETLHYGELPKQFVPVLQLDGDTLHVPSKVRVLADAEHHRTSVIVFSALPATLLDDDHALTLLLPQTGDTARGELSWQTPLAYPESMQPRGLTLGLLLTLAAGLLAAISPCLLQLTAFYLPTLAGISMDPAQSGGRPATDRRRIITTAAIFIAGFTIPYTAGGALIGGMGEAVVGSSLLAPDGPIVICAGVVMIVMAAAVAYRARAPLVCKLPVPRAIYQSRRLPFVETFVSGFAIATGCLACFGGAIFGVLLVYTGMLGSARLGALAMLVFSLGVAIPFMLAAIGLSWIMPLAMRLQRLAPAIGLVSSLVMLLFGIIMVTGNFHVASGWLALHLPLR